MSRSLLLPLLCVVLVAGLLFPPLSPYTAVYVVLASLVLALILLSQRYWEVFGLRPFQLVWLAIVTFLLTLPFAYKNVNDLLVFLFLAPIFIAPAMVMLLREAPQLATPQAIGFFCLAGAAGAAGVALNDIFVLQLDRAEGGNNAIHFGGLSLILGFLAVVGLFGSKSPWRFLFIAGPVFGIVATFLSGSRGPVLAAAVLTLVVSPFLLVWFWRELGFKIVLLIGIVGMFGMTTQVDPAYLVRAASTFSDIANLFTEEAIDSNTQERLVIYRAAANAFSEAPIFGHGSGHIASAIAPHIPDDFASLRQPDHLHSDIADFAVIGGLLGLVAYLFLLVSPLFTFMVAAGTDTRRALFLGGAILSVGYFCLGLTNAMFGILPQTMLFGLMLGIFTAMAQISTVDTD